MTTLVDDVRQRTTSGVRAVLVLNLATVPFSFATNMMLGRVSPDALGYYSAINILVNGYYTVFVLGGAPVFTRFSPAVNVRERLSFFVAYLSLMLLVFGALVVSIPVLAPDLLERTLERLGVPSFRLGATLILASIPWGFGFYFLYSVLRPASAAAAEKSVVFLFFIWAVVGSVFLRDDMVTDPARFLWVAAPVIYGLGAVLGIAFVFRTEEFRVSRGIRWHLPAGFWSAAWHSQLFKVVDYAHLLLAPSLVLVWLDVGSLGHLHAALRYVVLFSVVPFAVGRVLGPAVSRLDVAGLQAVGFGQAAGAIRTTLLLLGPAVLALVFFAGDAMALIGPEFRGHRFVLVIAAVGVMAAPVSQAGQGIAAAVGAFRSYVVASVVYVSVAVLLTVTLVPKFGLTGAAFAHTIGSLVRQTSVLVVLRRMGFPAIPRVRAAWACVSVAAAIAFWLDPSRVQGALLWGAFVAVFAWTGRVTREEIRVAVGRLVGSR